MNVQDNNTAQDYLIISGGCAVLYCIIPPVSSMLEYIRTDGQRANDICLTISTALLVACSILYARMRKIDQARGTGFSYTSVAFIPPILPLIVYLTRNEIPLALAAAATALLLTAAIPLVMKRVAAPLLTLVFVYASYFIAANCVINYILGRSLTNVTYILGDIEITVPDLAESNYCFAAAAGITAGWVDLARTEHAKGDTAAVARAMRRAPAATTDDPLYTFLTSVEQMKRGNNKDAMALLKKGTMKTDIRKDTIYATINLVALGRMMLAEGDSAGIDSISKAVELLDIKMCDAINMSALAMAIHKTDLTQATLMNEATLATFPEHDYYKRTKAIILYKKKDYRGAWEWLGPTIYDPSEETPGLLEIAGDIAMLMENTKGKDGDRFFTDEEYRKEVAMGYWKEAARQAPDDELLARKIRLGRYVE